MGFGYWVLGLDYYKTDRMKLWLYSAAFVGIEPFIYLYPLLITDLKNCRIKM